MPRRGTEVPQNGLIVLRKQRKPADFVLRPAPDMRCREVTHIVHVKTKKRAYLGFRQQRFRARQPFAAQPVKIDALLPIHRHGSVRLQCHNTPPMQRLSFSQPPLSLARTTPAPPQTPTPPSAPSYLPAAAKMEWAHASLPCASPAPLNCKKLRRQS